jgi:hypothetical protein
MEENIFAPPPTKDIEKIIRAFERTGIYSKEFLSSLKKGRPSLKTELLEQNKIRICSFKIDRKYRVIFREKGIVEIIDVNDHYQ